MENREERKKFLKVLQGGLPTIQEIRKLLNENGFCVISHFKVDIHSKFIIYKLAFTHFPDLIKNKNQLHHSNKQEQNEVLFLCDCFTNLTAFFHSFHCLFCPC